LNNDGEKRIMKENKNIERYLRYMDAVAELQRNSVESPEGEVTQELLNAVHVLRSLKEAQI